ncbi:uncharacterized protein LOC119553225 isoform X7 [Drosophila subpulchrella]|uniref:uncharacterized protein LOC119553225 isoform X7 n=1 Tax=Drosophila subpulchrella TaxID=1486046 RepID=UPI0018A12F48|nr:uncharacterized protein LOC119553225 isoform X7 [Drosophila subpulchrella]
MDIELPYMAEYARSGRANCKGCKCSIPKDNLRIAVMVQTLGMIELGGSHTGIYMKNKILEVLDDYGISLDQIYSVTSDNGRNMIKAVQVLNDATEESLFEEDTESENLLNELDTIELANIHLVRCAAHTLQLCVFDVNKAKEIADKISSCRTLCKSLRTETYRHKHQMFRRSKLLCVKRCLTPHSRQLFQPHPHLKRSRCSRHFWTIFRQFQKAKKILFLQNLSKFMLTSKTSTLLLGACH